MTEDELAELIERVTVVKTSSLRKRPEFPGCQQQEWEEYLAFECTTEERDAIFAKELEDPEYAAEVERCRAGLMKYGFLYSLQPGGDDG